jgi:iron complex outermembrane receptor protein
MTRRGSLRSGARQRRDRARRRPPLAIGLAVAAMAAQPGIGHAQSVEDLRNLSIEQLANIQISSVSKSAESLSDAPAAVFVISHDDIIRSGATSIPEMLRLAPNLEVAQLNATSYAISARGFNVGDNASLSNKLLVLIDGRSVYTPLFGGVYWDMQEVLPEDIDHIEVISGPGATLWGANAVNGVINIITRPSSDTQGGLLTLGAGNLERTASLQYGGRLGEDLTYRAHVEGFDYSSYQEPNGQSAHDGWYKPQGGFRLDWTPPNDSVSAQGDIYAAHEDPNGYIEGRDLLSSWRHEFEDGSNLQLQAYYDQAGRFVSGGSGFSINTYDLDVQHSFALGSWNNIVWGVGERAFNYRFENTALQLVPPNQTLNLANIFAQDTASLSERLNLTLGLKIEDEPYARLQAMPSARVSLKATDTTLLWAAVSRAVRSPTPVDENLREFGGAIDFLNGSTGFRPETLTAYEAGVRMQPTPRVSFSVSTFYDVYDHLRSIDLSPTSDGLPLVFGNLMAGTIYGVEVWGNYQVTPWWRLTAGFNIQHENLRFLPGSSTFAGLAFVSDDPNHQASLRSAINLGSGVTWDADLRYVGELPHPMVPAYAELNTRLGWQISKSVDASLSGFNLLHARHIEFLEDGETDEVPRSFLAEVRFRF